MPYDRRHIGWWSPDPRGILPLDGLRVSRSLRRSRRRFEVTVDESFEPVMTALLGQSGCLPPSSSENSASTSRGECCPSNSGSCRTGGRPSSSRIRCHGWLHDRTVHQVGLPIHWSFAGECVGATTNDLTSLVSEPNVSIHEGKAFACQVEASPPDLPALRPTVPVAAWPTRDPVPETPSAAQPEGRFDHGDS